MPIGPENILLIGREVVRAGRNATMLLKAEVGFLNEETPIQFLRKQVYVCLLAETSDGRVMHFSRVR